MVCCGNRTFQTWLAWWLPGEYCFVFAQCLCMRRAQYVMKGRLEARWRNHEKEGCWMRKLMHFERASAWRGHYERVVSGMIKALWRREMMYEDDIITVMPAVWEGHYDAWWRHYQREYWYIRCALWIQGSTQKECIMKWRVAVHIRHHERKSRGMRKTLLKSIFEKRVDTRGRNYET